MIPTNTADMTARWLTEVLRDAKAIDVSTVVAVDHEPVGAGVGLMGELTRVALTYDDAEPEAPSSVIVKVTSPYEANRAQGIALGMYEAEVRFYNELAGRALVRVPQCYLAELDPATSDFVIVLEDLGGWVVADQVDGMSVQQAEVAADALADLHACFWQRVDDLDWIPSVAHERIKVFSGAWPDLWASFSHRFADRLPEGAISAGEQIRDHYWSLMCTLGDRPWTLLHQDFRCDNLFFGAAPRDASIVVIDWQGIGRGPGAYDLAYLLGGSLPIDDRRQHEERIVRRYHERIVDQGVSDYTFDDLWADYRLSHLVSTAVPVLTGGTMDLANERGRRLIGTLGERHFTAVLDLRSVDLIP
ncbi:MAG: ecdysteroid 22-kinase family protein [Actinomycetota bacterium]|nr:ecdysteroid 22-kinase family protein [Actinomycetota bacterium]